MALIVKDSGFTDFELPKIGTVQAVVSNVYDIGYHNCQGQYPGNYHQVIVLFEIAQKMATGPYKGQRFTLSQKYTLSFSEKSRLRKDVEAILSVKFGEKAITEGFDLESLVGANCLVQLIHNTNAKTGRVNTQIQTFIGLPDGFTPMTPELDRVYCPEWVCKLAQNQDIVGSPQKPVARNQMPQTDRGLIVTMYDQINIWAQSGAFDFTAVKKQIAAVAGAVKPFANLSIGEAEAVYNYFDGIVNRNDDWVDASTPTGEVLPDF